jgi:2-methylcitrate dehydratase PrpD
VTVTTEMPDMAEFAQNAIDMVSPRAMDVARMRIFDWLVALHGGSSTGEAERATVCLDRLAGTGSVPVLWREFSAGPIEAALAMARVSRSSEIDDLNLSTCTTPGAVVIPAVLSAAGLDAHISAERVLDAVVVGYEAVVRLGRAIDGPAALFKGVWPTLAAAPLGAAAAVTRVLGGDAKALERALHSAGELTVLGRPGDRRDRYMSFGCAVANGVLVGVNAVLGQISPSTSRWSWPGYLPTKFEASALFGAGESSSEMERTGTKPFCAGGQSTQAIGLALAERETLTSVNDVRLLDVFVPAQVFDMVRSSIGVGVGVALVQPDELWNCNRGDMTRNLEIEALSRKTRVHVDDALTRRYPAEWSARVVIETESGATMEWFSEAPILAPMNSWQPLLEKAKRAMRATPAEEVERIGALCREFDQLGELLRDLGSLLYTGSGALTGSRDG